MGNSFTCFHAKAVSDVSANSRRSSPPVIFSGGKRASSSRKEERLTGDEALIRRQALEAVLLFKHHQSRKSDADLALSRSTSVRDSTTPKKRQTQFPRSTSTRPPSLTDSLVQPQQLVDQDDGLETKHFVLVHGGGFGAWCWYKSIALLKQSGFEVDAVDLTGSGIHSFETNAVTSLAQYVKPLTDLLEKLGDGEKVILVGHDFGGSCISYAMELFPSKVAKAVFIAAAMPAGGQSTLDALSHQTGADGLMQRAKIFVHGNGKDNPPTAIDFDKALVEETMFNQSPDRDIALASVSMRPIPFAPVLERLSLADANYGSVRRFYIKTQDDCAIPVALQETMIGANPPEQVFLLKGSDHSPFFSKPQALHRLLLEISKMPPQKASPSRQKTRIKGDSS